MNRALLIGGLDPSAGAGIVLDAFVAARLGFAPASVATVLTAQNSVELLGSQRVDPESLRLQLRAIAEDGEIACVKIGAVGSAANASEIARFLEETDTGPVVFDPVLASSSGGALLDGGTEELVGLMRACDVVTPNAAEAARLSGRGTETLARVIRVAEELSLRLGAAILITGVRCGDSAADVLAIEGGAEAIAHPMIPEAGDPRGTGCAFSTAIAARMRSSASIAEAVREAQNDLLRLVSNVVALGKGRRQFDLTSGWAGIRSGSTRTRRAREGHT